MDFYESIQDLQRTLICRVFLIIDMAKVVFGNTGDRFINCEDQKEKRFQSDRCHFIREAGLCHAIFVYIVGPSGYNVFNICDMINYFFY